MKYLLALLAGALACAAWAQNPASANAVDRKKTCQTPAAKVTFVDSPSAETPAQRDKRLTRECKGRPNAGVCLGYAKP
jgi:hypothetical protein